MFDQSGDNQSVVLGVRYRTWWPCYGQFEVGWLQPFELWLSAGISSVAPHLPCTATSIIRSKLDYGCIVYGSPSSTDLRQLHSIHNSGLRQALGVFCTSPVSSLYKRPTKLLWRNAVKAVHALISEISCLHWQSSTSCPAWFPPNH